MSYVMVFRIWSTMLDEFNKDLRWWLMVIEWTYSRALVSQDPPLVLPSYVSPNVRNIFGHDNFQPDRSYLLIINMNNFGMTLQAVKTALRSICSQDKGMYSCSNLTLSPMSASTTARLGATFSGVVLKHSTSCKSSIAISPYVQYALPAIPSL